MGRYILNGMTGLSLLVCLATGVMWIRSVWYADRVTFYRAGYSWCIDLEPGSVLIERELKEGGWMVVSGWYSEKRKDRPLRPFWKNYYAGSSKDQYSCGLPGTRYNSYSMYGVVGARAKLDTLAIAYWLIVLLTLILPVSRIRFRKRYPPGHCSKCGYDLRATTDRCPECGTVVDLAPEMRSSATEDTKHTEEEK